MEEEKKKEECTSNAEAYNAISDIHALEGDTSGITEEASSD